MKRETVALILLNLLHIAASYGQRAVFAYYYGTAPELDAYFLALVIPNVVVFVFQAVGNASLAVGAQIEAEHGDRSIAKYWGRMFWLCLLALSAVLPLVMWQLPAISQLIAGNLHAAEVRRVTTYSYLVFPAQFGLQGLSLYLITVLSYRRRYYMAKVATLTPLAVLCLGVAWLHGTRGVTAAATALTIGTIGQFALCVIASRGAVDFREMNGVTKLVRSPLFKQVLGQAFPVMMLTVNGRFMTAADNVMAAALGAGAVSLFSYAYGLFQIPQLIFTQASTVVKTRDFFQNAASKDHQLLVRDILDTLDTTLFLIFPSTIGLMILRLPAVRLMFEHGHFQGADTDAVARLLVWFVPVSIFWAMWICLSTPLVALQRAGTVLRIEIFTTALSIGGNFLFRPIFGLGGLVLSTAIAILFTVCAFLAVLKRDLPELDLGRLWALFTRHMLAALLMGWLCQLLLFRLEKAGVTDAVSLAVVIPFGVACFAASGYFLRLPDMMKLAAWINGRLSRARQVLSPEC